MGVIKKVITSVCESCKRQQYCTLTASNGLHGLLLPQIGHGRVPKRGQEVNINYCVYETATGKHLGVGDGLDTVMLGGNAEIYALNHCLGTMREGEVSTRQGQ